MAPPFAYDVAVLKITVAALMTTDWIARALEVPAGVGPGPDSRAVRGRPAARSPSTVGVPVEKGPEGPARDSRATSAAPPLARDYGAWDIEILAEINNAPRLTRDAVRAAGGLLPRRPAPTSSTSAARPACRFPALGDVVRELVADGHARQHRHASTRTRSATAVAAGAELVLSVNGSNIDVAPRSRRHAARASSSCPTSAARSTRSSRASTTLERVGRAAI